MKKILSFLFIFLFVSISSAYAVKNYKISKELQIAIQKYKAKNYVGALVDFKKITDNNPNDSFANYYLGNIYASIGKSTEATEAYTKVIEVNDVPGLVLYATAAKNCLEDETKCGEVTGFNTDAEMNNFIRSGKFMDTKANEQVRDKELNDVRDMINNKNDVDFSKYKYLNDAKDSMPSDKEIADAVKTLAKVGFNPLNNYGTNNMMQLGYLDENNLDNSNALYMLPYMLKNNSDPSSNAKFVQSFLTNQMFAGMDFSSSNRGF